MRYAGPHEPAWVDDYLPRVDMPGWRLVEDRLDGAFFQRLDKMTVIVSGAMEQDGKRWLHVSFARPSRLPDWEDMMLVKDIFVGRQRKAVSVIPPRAEHVNIHPNCLHLFHCVDDDPLPDFTRGGGTL